MWWGSGPRLHWLMEGVSGSGNASVPRLAAPSALTAPSSGACFQACLQTSVKPEAWREGPEMRPGVAGLAGGRPHLFS